MGYADRLPRPAHTWHLSPFPGAAIRYVSRQILGEEVVFVAPMRTTKHRSKFWHGLAEWLGVGPAGLTDGAGELKPATVALFQWLNGPWTTIASVGVILALRTHLPSLPNGYVIAGLAGIAAVARVAPTLTQMALRPSTTRPALDIHWTVPHSAIASRRALGWALLSFLILPWVPPGHIRLDWLILVVPASFAGRALWEPWWWRVAWRTAKRLT